MIRRETALASLAALAACTAAQQTGPHQASSRHNGGNGTIAGRTALMSAQGSPVGEAVLRQAGNEIILRIDARGLPAGPKGTHIHMVGLCEAPGFASAGGHLNPAGHQHGSLNALGRHLGDLPNLVIGTDGTGTLEAALSGPAGTVLAQIFDADGAAVVIHASPDDQKTDPSGNSGPRIACGALTRTP